MQQLQLIHGNDNAVITYDYLETNKALAIAFGTVEALQKTKRAEKRERIRRERKERVNTIMLYLTLFFFMCICPLMMFFHWLVFGYIL